jgi:serine/threonine-protein kinase
VALKLLLPHLAQDKESVALFTSEARTAAELEHPNICRVFELGEADGFTYIARELVEGSDLRRMMKIHRLRGRPAPLPVALHLVSEICAGLEYAHRRPGAADTEAGIVHGDVSPQNVLVSLDGQVKLIDFGVSRPFPPTVHRGGGPKRLGQVVGKLAYLSPEVLDGRPMTPQSDLFACGILLYELLTNTRLYRGKNPAATVERSRSREIPCPSAVRADLPRPLDSLVLQALAREPSDRFASAEEMQRALGRIAVGTGADVAAWMRSFFAR